MSVHKTRFDAELVEGHKGVTVVIVPFDPEEQWSRKPARLAGRRHGWPVAGTINRIGFDGYVGERWGRFFIIVEPEMRAAAGLTVGDTVAVAVAPSDSQRAFERALAQSGITTQPKTARPDAIARARG
ncbi:MAG TPA: DUF1905 domain-containing protein [Polyangia bacterium]|nr:DUF1905 domain-containing protein [Polyangia bacterium]